jgi:hypothetical protein
MSGKPTCEPLAGATRHFSPVVIATSTREQIRAATACTASSAKGGERWLRTSPHATSPVAICTKARLLA